MKGASGQAAFTHAAQVLTMAIDARPTFARAYVERSNATHAARSTQITGVSSSTPDSGALERSTQDLRMAESLGLESSRLLDGLGYSDLLLGITAGRPELIEGRITYIQRALARDPDEVVSRLNLGMGLLAAQRVDEARHAYERAMLSALHYDAEAANQERRPPEDLRNDPGARVGLRWPDRLADPRRQHRAGNCRRSSRDEAVHRRLGDSSHRSPIWAIWRALGDAPTGGPAGPTSGRVAECR
jgi:tetratricopeptide (TPR) repeat protein